MKRNGIGRDGTILHAVFALLRFYSAAIERKVVMLSGVRKFRRVPQDAMNAQCKCSYTRLPADTTEPSMCPFPQSDVTLNL